MFSFNEVVELTRMDCGKCGGTYAINEVFRLRKQQYGGEWHCPYCDSDWHYTETRLNQLKKELEQKQVALTAAKCDALREANLRAEAERKLNRAKNGVCPCCNRSFKNLKRHMKTKHKEFLKAKP